MNSKTPEELYYDWRREFDEIYLEKGYRAVKLEVKNEKRTIRANSKTIR